MTSEAKQYAQRNRQGSDWFYHDAPAAATAPAQAVEKAEENSPVMETVLESENTAETHCEQQEPEDATRNGEPAYVSTQAQMIKPKCDSNQWFKHDQSDSQETKSPRTPREGEAYCRRDKTGSSASWYKHEHDGEETSGQQKPETIGSANAARMRSESDQWFSHEGAAEANETKKPHPGRPVSTEIHGVFHHN